MCAYWTLLDNFLTNIFNVSGITAVYCFYCKLLFLYFLAARCNRM